MVAVDLLPGCGMNVYQIPVARCWGIYFSMSASLIFRRTLRDMPWQELPIRRRITVSG